MKDPSRLDVSFGHESKSTNQISGALYPGCSSLLKVPFLTASLLVLALENPMFPNELYHQVNPIFMTI